MRYAEMIINAVPDGQTAVLEEAYAEGRITDEAKRELAEEQTEQSASAS